MDRDSRQTRAGLVYYNAYFKLTCPTMKKPKTVEDFIKSKVYNNFVSFAKYVEEINAIQPNDFLRFLVKNNIHIDRWEQSVVYELYVRELNKKESPLAAVERHLLLAQQWSIKTENEPKDFFRYITVENAVLWIRSGRISPWVLFNCQSASDLISRMSEEQINLVNTYLDPHFWSIKIEMNRKDADIIRDVLTEFGM